MKLAIIRRQHSSTGGAELYLQRLLSGLTQQGHEIHLFAESWAGETPELTLHRIQVSGSRADRPWRFARTVRDEISRGKFDCVFSLERTLKQDVYRAGDGLHRVWLTRRGEFAPRWRRPLIGLGRFHRNMVKLEAATFSPANTRHIIVNSEMIRREIHNHFDFPDERIHLVRNGVDLVRFQSGNREKTRALFGVKRDDFLILFVGSGWERKGLRFLLAALNKIQLEGIVQTLLEGVTVVGRALQDIATEVNPWWNPATAEKLTRASTPFPAQNVKLLVVGKGRRPARSMKNVIFAGPMLDVENAYAAADLFVFLPIYEPSSNVVVEALAAGLPVITSIQNGASEVIDENVNGTVVGNPADISAVAQAISFWISRRFYVPLIKAGDLSLDLNVLETTAVLELAVRERGRPSCASGAVC